MGGSCSTCRRRGTLSTPLFVLGTCRFICRGCIISGIRLLAERDTRREARSLFFILGRGTAKVSRLLLVHIVHSIYVRQKGFVPL